MKKLEIKDVLVNSLGSLFAGVIGSLIMIALFFFVSGITSEMTAGFSGGNYIVMKTSTMVPILLSVIVLIGTSISMFLTYKLINMTSPERYKKRGVILGQIAFFMVFVYIFITPVYIFEGLKNYQNILYIFLVHTLILVFGTSVIIEILNNYRRVLLGFYGSFIGLFISTILTLIIFSFFPEGYAKLVSLIILLPIINFSTTFFKQLFELTYASYVTYSNNDPIGDIFYQIEMEERETGELEEEKNLI